MLSRIRLFAGILVVAVASAYVSDPLLLTRPAYLRHGLALQSSDDSFQDRWNPNHESETNGYSHRQTPMDSSSSLTAQNVAQFCSKVGCTIQDYQWTVERLKRRKVELSKQMLAAEDELEFEKKQKLQTSQRNSGISVLKERRKKLSDRALAIQNLLATLRALEETAPMGASPPQATGARAPKKGTKEIVERYREILEAERMQKFEVTKASKPTGSKMHHKALHTQRKDVSFSEYWNSLWTPRRQPQPPHLPPTVKQFMSQYQADHSLTNNEEEDVDEKYTREWFGRQRVTTYPFSTFAASKRTTKKTLGRARAATHPFSFNSNSTSTMR